MCGQGVTPAMAYPYGHFWPMISRPHHDPATLSRFYFQRRRVSGRRSCSISPMSRTGRSVHRKGGYVRDGWVVLQ